MHNSINLLNELALVYGQSVIHPFLTAEHVVCDLVAERSNGYALPEPDAYARRMAEQAEAWLSHARARARMKNDTLVRKALHSLAFSFRHRAHFAVPSKLSGTSKHQPVLWRLTRERVGFGTPLDVEEVRDEKKTRLVVRYEGDVLGEVQSKHVPWLRPLLPFGAGVFLTRVTGHEERYTLGLNVAFGRVGTAVEALNRALGADLDAAHSGDGYGGDGAAVTSSDGPGHGPVEADVLPEHSGVGVLHHGDGASGGLQLVTPAQASDPDDIVLYREIDGTACASVEHAVRHSPSGIEWGYHGSGPADLARSILLAFTDEATAEALYQRFKAEVVAAVPKAGGVIRAIDVRTWLAARSL